MKVTTESGSVYNITAGICTKSNNQGRMVDVFKVFYMKSVPDSVNSIEELRDLPRGIPEVGNRLYIGGKDSWWLSTKVVSIEE